ncbi:hypothetical protein Pelo_2347 [Pelomyxa schiedti]|nr:hypothetical protein Pelo_2347 [Pelomyxa schiedti]
MYEATSISSSILRSNNNTNSSSSVDDGIPTWLVVDIVNMVLYSLMAVVCLWRLVVHLVALGRPPQFVMYNDKAPPIASVATAPPGYAIATAVHSPPAQSQSHSHSHSHSNPQTSTLPQAKSGLTKKAKANRKAKRKAMSEKKEKAKGGGVNGVAEGPVNVNPDDDPITAVVIGSDSSQQDLSATASASSSSSSYLASSVEDFVANAAKNIIRVPADNPNSNPPSDVTSPSPAATSAFSSSGTSSSMMSSGRSTGASSVFSSNSSVLSSSSEFDAPLILQPVVSIPARPKCSLKRTLLAFGSRLVQFHALLFSFFACTSIYGMISMLPEEDVNLDNEAVVDGLSYLLGTVAHCLFFTALLVMLLHMLEHMNAELANRKLLVSTLSNVIFWLIMSIPYFYTLATTVYFIMVPDALADGNIIYDTAIITIVVYCLMCAIAYCITAALIVRKVYILERNDLFFKMKKRPVYLLIFVMAVCLISFLLQCAMLSYRPITGEYMNQYVFEVFTYWLPEVACSILLLIVARKPEIRRNYSTN